MKDEFKNKKLLTGLLLVFLVLIMIGGTFAAISFTRISDQNLIKSGNVSMSYTESSNVINVTDALPISDEVGKNSTEFFDFTIMSNASTNADDNGGITIPYDLIIQGKDVDSGKTKLSDNQIKVYLTKVEGGVETPVVNPTKISDLEVNEANHNLYSTSNVHKNNNGVIATNYRLRAWIDEGVDASSFKDNVYQYKFIVNVNSTGDEEEISSKDGVNPPVLANNMIPVYYDEGDNNWKKADSSNDGAYKWYDYDSKMWANAVTVSAANRATYLNASAGTTIPMGDINAMFVWIPRYKYTYMSEKCSSLTNPSEDTNPECYLYVYRDSYHDDIFNELTNRWNLSATRAEEIITIWKNGGVEEDNFEADFTDYVDPDIGSSSLDIPKTFMKENNVSVTPKEIKIEFEKGTASTGTIKCVDALGSKNGDTTSISQICTDSINGGLITNKSTYTHPAFTFGDKELTGIWVGKFENSGGSTVTIMPDVQTTRDIDLSTMFKNARSMELSGNVYGFPQSGTSLNSNTGEISGDSNNLDTHMMKNTEWGAVAYLSHSKYGKDSEVFINNSEDCYTGRSGGNVGGATQIKNTYTNQTSTESYNTYGFYTYDGYLLNYNTNTKSSTRNLNKVASTTGNIYGVYDMSGGSETYVMGNVQDSSNKFRALYAGTWNSSNKPLDKYYDKYSYNANRKIFSASRLGDAIVEMAPNWVNYSTWNGDYAGFPDFHSSWFIRGGRYSDDNRAGAFSFLSWAGSADSGITSYTVLTFED